MSSPLRRRTRMAALLMAAITAATLASFSPAAADTRPPAGIPATVTTDPLPTAQIDGVAWVQLIVGDTVYVGGRFGRARPAGAAPGTSTVVRSNLLSYNVTTGALTSWAPSVNGEVNALEVSPDGTRLYVGGSFTSVNGQARNRVAAFTIGTGALVSGWAPSANSVVQAIAARGSTVYLGGNFTAIGGIARTRVAAVSAANGAVITSFNARADGGRVRGVEASPDGARVVLAGSFTTLNGSSNPGYGLGAVNATTGANVSFPVAGRVRNAGTNAAIYSTTSDGDSVYGVGYHFGSGGNLEGAFRADWAGNLIWVEDCHGDTYSGAIVGNAYYIAGHPHYCGTSGGFPQTNPWRFQRGMAWSKQTSGRVANNQTLGYPSWAGTPIPHLLNWWPDFNTGTVTGSNQGPWSVAASPNYVVYGGEFTTVNGVRQQGLVRFAISSIAPNRDGPRLSGSGFPISASSPAANQVRATFTANYDRDNEFLTYQILRNGSPVGPTQVVASRIWYQRPSVTITATGVSGGQAQYSVRASDPFGNSQTSAAVTLTVGGGAIAQQAPADATAPTDPGTTEPDAGAVQPPAAAAVAVDDFGRSVTNGWGSAETGGVWTTAPAPSGTYSIDGSARLSLAPGQSAGGILGGVSVTDADATVTVAVDALPASGTLTGYLLGRRTGSGDYRAAVVIDARGAVTLELQRSGTVLASAPVPGVTAGPGAAVTVRLQVTGTSPTTLSAKAWAAGAAEPADWLLTATDGSAALQAAGSPGLGGSASAGLTNGPGVVLLDGFAVRAP